MSPIFRRCCFAPTVLALMLSPVAQPTAGSGPPPAAATMPQDTDDPAVLQSLLKATDEEWSVIFPQLEHIRALRDELQVTSEAPLPDRRGMFGGAFEGPMGGTSLDAPVMPERFGNRRGARGGPFDPANAPGRASDSSPGLLRAFRGLAGHAMINFVLADQQHPVLAALSDLHTLLDATNSTDAQIRDQLAIVRAARQKMARDLDAAQKDLAPFLTLDQTAILVTLGYLD